MKRSSSGSDDLCELRMSSLPGVLITGVNDKTDVKD